MVRDRPGHEPAEHELVVLALCALEFVGPDEPRGWRVAETLTPPAYVAWSPWLGATGVALLAG